MASLSFFSDVRSLGPCSPAAASDLADDARWDDGFGFGVTEEPFSRVHSVAVVENSVFVGGRFTAAGGVPVSGIARWDGNSWSNVGGGLDDCRGIFCYPTVYALEVRGKELYAGGNFASVGGVPANRVARWDGDKWSALGGGIQICDRFNDCVTVWSIAATDSELYAVGRIVTDVAIYGATATLESFTKWDGNIWAILGGVSGASHSLSLYAIEATDSRVYVGGVFSLAGVLGANNVASWDGNNWVAMGSGVQGCINAAATASCAPFVYTIAASGNDVYVGGNFTSAGDVSAKCLAKWDGSKWTPFGEGANGPVYKIAIYGNSIYVGGKFTSIGGVQANGIARFDGNEWSALGSGVDGYVDAIAFKDNEVYVGGLFSTAGGKTANNFARWIGPAIAVAPPPPPVLPQIVGVSIVRKKLIVTGARFGLGAQILLNGEVQRTRNDEQNPTATLIAPKSGKKARNGDLIQVRNPDGKLSPEFTIAR
jgi:hypothetical protein